MYLQAITMSDICLVVDGISLNLQYLNLCLMVLPAILESQEETNADESGHYPSIGWFIIFFLYFYLLSSLCS